MKANKGLIVGLIVGVAVLAAGGFFAARAMKGPPKPTYLTATAKMADVESAVLATGALQPADVVHVGSQTSGIIVSMGVKLGDEVKAGQLIANIDPTNLNNQVRQQETQVAQAQAQLNSVRANLTLTQSTLNRNQVLLEKGAGTQQSVDSSTAQLASTQANLTQQQNNLRNQELNLENARNNLDRANIRSPIDGIIAEVVSHQGQTINTNQTVPIIVKVAKMDVMTVRTQVSEADIIKVHPGQKVYFTILGEPGRRYYATRSRADSRRRRAGSQRRRPEGRNLLQCAVRRAEPRPRSVPGHDGRSSRGVGRGQECPDHSFSCSGSQGPRWPPDGQGRPGQWLPGRAPCDGWCQQQLHG